MDDWSWRMQSLIDHAHIIKAVANVDPIYVHFAGDVWVIL